MMRTGRVARMGASRFAPRQVEDQWRLAPAVQHIFRQIRNELETRHGPPRCICVSTALLHWMRRGQRVASLFSPAQGDEPFRRSRHRCRGCAGLGHIVNLGGSGDEGQWHEPAPRPSGAQGREVRAVSFHAQSHVPFAVPAPVGPGLLSERLDSNAVCVAAGPDFPFRRDSARRTLSGVEVWGRGTRPSSGKFVAGFETGNLGQV